MQTLVVRDPLDDLARLEGVPSAVASARDAVDVILRDRGLRAIAAEFTARALLAGAHASASLTVAPERWLPGAVRLSTELMELSTVLRVAPGQAISRAHTLVGRGVVDDADLGRVRAEPEVSERMVGLFRLLTRTSAAPSIVLAATVHAEIATLRPFVAGNGIVARACERMVLVSSGLDPRAVIVVEASYARDVQAYRQALDGYASGEVVGIRDWLVHCARAVGYGAEISPLNPRDDRT